jgi:hypothetical protein
MFAQRLSIQRIDERGERHVCALRWIGNFAIRNFTNDAIFDNTLPVSHQCAEK